MTEDEERARDSTGTAAGSRSSSFGPSVCSMGLGPACDARQPEKKTLFSFRSNHPCPLRRHPKNPGLFVRPMCPERGWRFNVRLSASPFQGTSNLNTCQARSPSSKLNPDKPQRTTKVSDRRPTVTFAEAGDCPITCDLVTTRRGGGSLHRLVMRSWLRAWQVRKRPSGECSPPVGKSPRRLRTPCNSASAARQNEQCLPHAFACPFVFEIKRIGPTNRGSNVRLAPHNDQGHRQPPGSGRWQRIQRPMNLPHRLAPRLAAVRWTALLCVLGCGPSKTGNNRGTKALG